MFDAWQDVIALGLVAGSVVVLARRCRLLLFPRGSETGAAGCPSGCGGCGSNRNREAGGTPLVTIGLPGANRPRS